MLTARKTTTTKAFCLPFWEIIGTNEIGKNWHDFGKKLCDFGKIRAIFSPIVKVHLLNLISLIGNVSA